MTRPVFDLLTVPLLLLYAKWRKLEHKLDVGDGRSVETYQTCAHELLDVLATERSFITAGELAKQKDVSRSAVYQWARAGKIETYELGGRKFFLDGEVKDG